MFRRLSEQAFESCSRVYAPGNQKKKEKSGTAFNHCQIFHAQKYENIIPGTKTLLRYCCCATVYSHNELQDRTGVHTLLGFWVPREDSSLRTERVFSTCCRCFDTKQRYARVCIPPEYQHIFNREEERKEKQRDVAARPKFFYIYLEPNP